MAKRLRPSMVVVRSMPPGVTTIWQQPIRNRIDMLATGIPTQVGRSSGPI
jgi:Cu/Ag efflux pump CusA